MTPNADFVALAQNDTSKRPTPILKLSADAGTADYAGIFGRGSADLHAHDRGAARARAGAPRASAMCSRAFSHDRRRRTRRFNGAAAAA